MVQIRPVTEDELAVGRDRGAVAVAWSTQLDNRRAQRLYESTGAARSAWFEYEIALD